MFLTAATIDDSSPNEVVITSKGESITILFDNQKKQALLFLWKIERCVLIIILFEFINNKNNLIPVKNLKVAIPMYPQLQRNMYH